MLRRILFFIMAAVLLGAPFLVSHYWVFLFTEVFIFALFATSFNLLLGYTGLVSFGQAAFYAVGAYTTALILKQGPSSLWISIGGGVLVSFVFSILVGVLCVRLTALYFAMLTMAFSSMIHAIVFQWRSLTGGMMGSPAFCGLLWIYFPGWPFPWMIPEPTIFSFSSWSFSPSGV